MKEIKITNFIPVNSPSFRGKEKEYLNECIDSGWISFEGPFVERFEDEFAKHHHRTNGISVSNGTAALELAFNALELKPGDEVIMPSFTIISCARAILMSGATPVLVDVEIDSWNASPEAIINLISENTKAILVVHTYGLPVNLLPLMKICEKRNIHLIEDVAEAIGLKLNGSLCGSFGAISTFSFYPNKHITTGEGGMILTDDKRFAEKCRLMRNLAFEGKRRFVHHHLAPNYRLTNMQAAIGLAQLENLQESIEMKKNMGRTYLELLESFHLIQLPLLETSYAENIFWVFGILLKDQVNLCAQEMINRLNLEGIGCREFFWPIHEQPVFKNENFYSDEDAFPVSSKIARRGLYLPSGISLERENIEAVCKILMEILSTSPK